MIEGASKINFKDLVIAIPSFFIIVMMPLGYSISTGIQFGFITYILVCLASKRAKEVSPIIYTFAILFILQYIFNAIM